MSPRQPTSSRHHYGSWLACVVLLAFGSATLWSILTWTIKDIRFAEAELTGLRYLRPVASLLVQVPDFQHQRYSAPAPLLATKAVDDSFTSILAVNDDIRAKLNLDDFSFLQAGRAEAIPQLLHERWEQTKATPYIGARLLRETHNLISQVGDTSKLILDPDIDTYYLMEIVVLILPDSLERLAQAPPWNLIFEDESARAHTPGMMALLLDESDFARIRHAVRMIQTDDIKYIRPNNRKFDLARHEFSQRWETLLADLRSQQHWSETNPVSIVQARDAAWVLWNAAADLLEHRLELRLAELNQRRLLGIAVAVIGLSICLFIVFRFLLSELHLHKQADELATTRHTLESDAARRQTAEQRTRMIVDTALDAVVLMDSSGFIIDWNTQAEQIFGWTRDEAMGRRLSETVTPLAHRAAHEAGIKSFLSTGKGAVLGIRIEVPAIRRSGEEFSIELNINPLKVGDTWEFSAFVRDITERKRTEAELIAAKNDAEQAKQELISANDKLQKSLATAVTLAERAESASKAKSEFLAVMSHEIRTPMNGVIGMSQLLETSQLNETQKKWNSIIRTSGESLLTIINDILDFSKVEAGKLIIEQAPFDPLANTQEIVALLKPRAEAKGLTLQLQNSSRLPTLLLGDAIRFRQVITNLVGNALKFTPLGSVTVSLAWERETGRALPSVSDIPHRPAEPSSASALQPFSSSALPSPPVLSVRVTDTGIGITPETLPNLFQSFTQADSSTTRQFGGTGLGLAICKRLVELMGGQIGVESTVGRGSTFWFLLPLPIAQPEGITTQPAIPPPLPRHDSPLSGTSALLTDDSEINLLLGQEMLLQLGCVVTVATNGREAVALFEKQDFSIIFMDCRMPVVDGFAATAELRRLESSSCRARTPIIALTANAVEGDREKCLAAGMDDYLTKPFRRADLARILKQWSTAPQRTP